MRIAIQATQIVPGGGLTHFNRITEWFEKLAPECEFIVLGREGQQQLFESRPGNFHFRFYSAPAQSLVHRVYWEAVEMPRVLKKFQPDLLFVPGNQGAARVSVPKVSLIHNLAPFSREYISDLSPLKKLRQTLLRWSTISTIRSSQGVVLLSEYCREFFSKYVDDTVTKTAVVYHGRRESYERIDDRKVLNELGIDGTYLLCVSHIRRYKKIRELVLAYRAAFDGNGTMPRLYIAGDCEDVAYVESIKRLVEKSDFKNSVVFLGNVDETRLQALYRNCEALLFPSVLETCSVILIEAMNHGCAIACSDRSCLPEVTGRGALYYDPDNIDDFARKIRLIVGDRDVNSRLRQHSLRRAQDFSWKASSEQILDFFSEVLDHESARADRMRDLSAEKVT